MKRVNRTIVFLAVLMLTLLFTTGMGTAKTYTIKFATGHTPQISSGSVILELVDVIPERTNGRVKFKAFVGGSLYDDFSAPAQVASGALEMAYGGYNLSDISPGWNTIAGLPFVIDSYEHYLRFCETDAFKEMNAALERKGIKFISQAGHPGFANIFNNKRLVKSIDDFRELKMRIPPIPGMTKMCEIFKAQNVTISPPEVSTGLQTGMVDGTFCPIVNIKRYNLAENTPYATVANTTLIPQTIIANTRFWNSLPPDLQVTLTQVFDEYGEKINQGFRTLEDTLWNVYRKSPGTHLHYLEPKEKVKWQNKVRPVWQGVTAENAEARMVLNAIESTRNN